MSGERDSYRQILKATSVFGGVQVFSIIINLIKSKVIAVFLGTEGMGIYSLLQNPVNLVSQISGLGLNSSGIRDVAQHADDKIEFSKTVKTVQSWSRVTGLVGTIILFLMAPIISQWTFGNSAYSLDFRFLSLRIDLKYKISCITTGFILSGCAFHTAGADPVKQNGMPCYLSGKGSPGNLIQIAHILHFQINHLIGTH